jgi:hypothetical protein
MKIDVTAASLPALERNAGCNEEIVINGEL